MSAAVLLTVLRRRIRLDTLSVDPAIVRYAVLGRSFTFLVGPVGRVDPRQAPYLLGYGTLPGHVRVALHQIVYLVL